MNPAPISSKSDIKGQLAVVAGATGDMGRAICMTLAREGADIVGVDISNMEKLKSDIQATGAKFAGFSCDIRDNSDVKHTIREIENQFQKIDILVNTVGICASSRWPSTKEEDWTEMCKINIFGTFHITEAVLEGMKKNHYGKIVLIGSMAGKIPGVAAGPHYSATKGAVHSYARTVARYAGPFGIYVNSIAPGPIEGQMVSNFPKESLDPAKFPLLRMGKPEDVAEAVLFLCSASSNWITGITLDVNGGFLMI